jgi:hypothetical protein
MVFKLVMTASRTWRRLQAQNQLPKVTNGVNLIHATTYFSA